MTSRPGVEAQTTKILQAARELLGEVEVNALKATQIAERASVSRATFYRCFTSVDEVVETLYLEFSKQVLSRLEGLLSNAQEDSNWIGGAVNAVLDDAVAMGPVLTSLYREELRFGSKASEHLENRVERQVEVLAQWWSENQSSYADPDLIRMVVLILQVTGLYVATLPKYQDVMKSSAQFAIEAMVARQAQEQR